MVQNVWVVSHLPPPYCPAGENPMLLRQQVLGLAILRDELGADALGSAGNHSSERQQ